MRLSFAVVTGASVVACGGATITNPNDRERPPAPVTQVAPTAEDITIESIEINQGVAILLDDERSPRRSRAPVLPDRPALVRVTLATATPKPTTPVAVTIRVSTAGAPDVVLTAPPHSVAAKKAPSSSFLPPDESNGGTAFDIPLAADLLRPRTTVSVRVDDPKEQNNPSAPPLAESFKTPLRVVEHAPTLKVVVVPIHYTAQGRDVLTLLDDAAMQSYRDGLYKMYPVASVELTKHAPLDWPLPIDPSGKGWDAVVHALINMHRDEAVTDDVYFTAIFDPGVPEEVFCKDGCVGGLAVNPFDFFGNEVDRRVSMILNYSSERVQAAFPQELAHSMGRGHAPCGGAAGVDPKYPYDDGTIGHWGYDVVTGGLVDETTYDFMSYCSPVWVSDYTYKGIFTRMLEIEATARAVERTTNLAHAEPLPASRITK